MSSSRPERLEVDAVVLDVGNTLVELDYELIATVARAGGIATSAEAVRRAEHSARGELDRWLGRSHRSTETGETLETYMRLVFAGLGAGETEAWRPLLGMRRLLWTRAAPAASQVLATLAARGHRLAAVSNSDGSVAALLGALGLAVHLELVVDSAVVGYEKPDPRIFWLALERLGVAPERALYVGDLMSVDVAGALAAGMHAALLDPAGTRRPEGALVLDDLERLLEVGSVRRQARNLSP